MQKHTTWQDHIYDSNDSITDSESSKWKIRIIGRTPAAHNTKDVNRSAIKIL